MWFNRDYVEEESKRKNSQLSLALVPATVLALLWGSSCNTPSARNQPQPGAKEQKDEAVEAEKFKTAIENNQQFKTVIVDIGTLKARVDELENLKDEIEKLKRKTGVITETIDTDRKVRNLDEDIEKLGNEIKGLDGRIKLLQVKIDAGKATRKDVDEYADLKAKRNAQNNKRIVKESERSRLTKSSLPANTAPTKR